MSERLLQCHAPADEVTLIPTSFEGNEGMSFPFLFTVEAFSDKALSNKKALLGKPLGITIDYRKQQRVFNGIVRSISSKRINARGQHSYQLELVPWFATLQLAEDCRVFQNLSTVDIFTQVCKQSGFHDIDTSKVSNKTKLPYVVQYHENSFVFLSRLLSEAGIFYYFEHSSSKHTMVLCDDSSKLSNGVKVPYANSDMHALQLNSWHESSNFHVASVMSDAYDFSKPTQDNRSTENNSDHIGKVYPGKAVNSLQYPALSLHKSQDTNALKHWNTGNTAAAQVIHSSGNCVSLLTAQNFSIGSSSDTAIAGKQFLTLSIDHHAQDYTHTPHQDDHQDTAQHYSNKLTCLPSKTPYQPAKNWRKPRLFDLQSAVVVGESGEAIDTNQYQQVKVQFHWDRYGKKDANSSCWLRVAQATANKDWGSQWIPRLGDEVLVGFLYGDPDQPIVMRSAYNSENKAPFNNPSISGFKTRSLHSKDATQGHELSFDDSAGKQVLNMHSSGTLTNKVGQNSTLSIDGKQTVNVDGDQILKILDGTSNIKAKTIKLCVGGSTVTISSSGINLHGGKVQFLASGVGGSYGASHIGNAHVCPQVTGNTPHVGGPIIKGSSTLLINGMPAARVGDPMVCVPAKDSISSGASNIKVDGKALAHLSSASSHGGKIVSASGNVSVGNLGSGNSLASGSAQFDEMKPKVGQHWIQAHYQGAKAGMPWTITTPSGEIKQGKLDGSGKTEKITDLQPGSATIEFGDATKTRKALAQQRAKLQTVLNQMLAQAKAQAAKDKAMLAKQPWWDEAYTYGKGFVTSLGEGAYNAGKAGVHAVAAMFEGIGDVIAFDARIQRDLMTGNQADLAKANQEVNAKVKKIIAKIKSGYATLKFLATDTDTHHMLEQFAEDYYHSMSKLMLLKDVANFTGGLIPAIIIGLITKNPEALGASMAATLGPMIEKAGGIIEEIVTLLKELKLCKTVEGADVDVVHTVASDALKAKRKDLAEKFYKSQGFSQDKIDDHIYGINKNYEVKKTVLKKGTILEQYQAPGRGQGNYYAEAGSKPTKLGINPKARSRKDGKLYDKMVKKYIVTQDTEALQSTAAPILDTWSDPASPYQTSGGATQYFTTENTLKEID